MTHDEAEQQADAIFNAVKAYLDKKIDVSDEKILAFEREAFGKINERLAAIEHRSMHWEGPHSPDRRYTSGACVQRSGLVFIALVDTAETPGSSDHWRRIGASK